MFEVIKLIGGVGGGMLALVFALSKWMIPALKRNGNGSHKFCPFGSAAFGRHATETEGNLNKLVALTEKQEVYLREMNEGIRRLETALTHLSAKLINGGQKS